MIDAAKALARLGLSQAKAEAGKAARVMAVEAVLWLLALFLLCLTLGFAVFAAYLGLASAFSPIIAALLMAGICLIFCLIIVLVVKLRHTRPRASDDHVRAGGHAPDGVTPPEMMPAILLAGFLTGLLTKRR